MTDKQQNILLKALYQSGVFVTSGEKDDSNILAAHWGTLGSFWNKPVFILPVRKSKYTHDLIEKHGYFGISVPIKDMRNEIIMCNHKTGRSANKFEELNLHPSRAKEIPPYLISECGMFLECRVIFSTEMNSEMLSPEIKAEFYENSDLHTLFIGEILTCYMADEAE